MKVTRFISLATTSLVAAGVLSLTATAAHAGIDQGEGEGKVHVFVNELGFPGFTNGWKWSSVHGTASAGFDGTRNGVGDYTIRFNGITAGGGNAQLVMWNDFNDFNGLVNPAACTIQSWAPDRIGTNVRVRCFDAVSGAAVDRGQFDVTFSNVNRTGAEVEGYDYLWSDVATFTGSRTPSAAYRYAAVAPGTAAPIITKLGTGRYDVYFQHSFEGAWPMVTAYGTSARWCNPGAWYDDPGIGHHYEVACFGPGGAPADSRFSMSVVERNFLTGLGGLGGNMWAGSPGSVATVTPVSYSYNYATASSLNSYTRTAAGRERLNFPSVGGAPVPMGWVVAYGNTGRRCVVEAYGNSGADRRVYSRCITPAGVATDTQLVSARWDLG